ncbi:hypothetical protein [Nostoc sp.]|uniref:hypothetical protein n=1 Tax=Nostoc sp. TaxID=1180 RepID=UPI002FF4EF8B
MQTIEAEANEIRVFGIRAFGIRAFGIRAFGTAELGIAELGIAELGIAELGTSALEPRMPLLSHISSVHRRVLPFQLGCKLGLSYFLFLP